jgi:hypothetical protein
VPNRSRPDNIDLREVINRNDAARHIVAGFSAEMPTLAEIWRYVEGALDDTLILTDEITRLTAELRSARLDHANLLAAVRAALSAVREGEPDPLSYLRDELTATGQAPQDEGERP